MFYSDLKQIYFIKNNSSLIADLSNDVGFFYKLFHHLTKISGIETTVIGQKHGAGACRIISSFTYLKLNEWQYYFQNISRVQPGWG